MIFRAVFVWSIACITSLSFIPSLVAAATEEEQLAELLQQLNQAELPEEEEETPQIQEVEAEVDSGDHNSATDILDAGMEDVWSLGGPESIEVLEVGSDFAVIQVTEALFNGAPVSEYKIYYSNSSLETQDFDKINDVIVQVEPTEEPEPGMANLRFPDLQAELTYFVVVTPVHPTDPNLEPLTMISSEVSFTTDAAEGSVDPEADVFSQVDYMYDSSAGAVDLSWNASMGDNVEINLRHQSEGTYQVVGVASASDGGFTFTVSQPGNYFLKLKAIDNVGNPVGKEHIQTIRVDEVTQVTQPVQAPPQVGPTTDFIIGLLILSAVVYLVYRFRRIEQ